MTQSSAPDSSWSGVCRPLLSVPLLNNSTEEIEKILNFVIHRSNEFLQSTEADHEVFYSSYVALCVNFVIQTSSQVSPSLRLEPVVQFLLKYLLKKCNTVSVPDTVLGPVELTMLIQKLCSAEPVPTSTLSQWAATLREAAFPDFITQPSAKDDEASREAHQQSEEGKSADFISSLSSYAREAEFINDQDLNYKEVVLKEELSDLSTHVFVELNGPQVILDYITSLPYLQRYADCVTSLLNNADMPKVTSSDCDSFASSVHILLDHMSSICAILSMAPVYTVATEPYLSKINHITLTSLYIGSYSIFCSAVNQTAEFKDTVSELVTKAIEILTEVSSGVKHSPHVAKHIRTNIRTSAGWLIFNTLQTLSNVYGTDVSSKQESLDVKTSIWSIAAQKYAVEGLNCLLNITKDSSSGQTPQKAPATSSSARLQEAHKFCMSQFNITQQYVHLDLIKFLCSGSNLRLSAILFSTAASLISKYNSLVQYQRSTSVENEGLEKSSPAFQKGEEKATDNEPIPSNYMENLTATNVDADKSSPSSCDEDGSDTGGDMFGELFSEDPPAEGGSNSLAVAEKDEDSTPKTTKEELTTTWAEVAAFYVTFIDKHIISSHALKQYLSNELCHSRSQQALSLLAVIVKSTSEHNDDTHYHQFCTCVRKLCRHMIQKEILDKAAQENMLLMVHLFPDNLIGWPIYAHRNMLSIMMDVMIHWQSMKDWGKDQVVVVEMWRHFLDAILSECITADDNVNSIEDVNVEHCQVLLSLLYTLSDDKKQQVFIYLAKTLFAALDIPRGQLVTMVPLPVTRLCILLEYMLQYLSTPSPQLLQQVKNNVISEEVNTVSFLDEGDLESVYTSYKDDKGASSHLSPTFYALCPDYTTSSHTPSLDPLAKHLLVTEELEEELELSDLYKYCLTAMLAGSSLDKVKDKEKLTSLDRCAVHYHIKVVWRLLGLLPPPPAFLLQMTDISTLGTQVAALQALRLAPQLRDSGYVQWYKEAMKGALADAELEGLLENVTLKTKSPLYEVQITLQILQAQMASLTFASPGEVVEPANLPGFHNIIILDAVLSQTLSLVDIHYQKLKESSSDGESSDYEEAKQIEFKRAADDLQPALLLMLGSFTQFVRSSLLHRVADSSEEKAAYAKLLPLTLCIDSKAFEACPFTPNKLSKELEAWKSESFSRFPSLSKLAESSAETFATAVIHGHCATISHSASHWSTLVSLRHLQFTLIKITSDLCSWFPVTESAPELCRTLIPLLFDGSVRPSSTTQISNCLNQVIGHVKVKEEKCFHVMQSWNDAILNLPDLSKRLGAEMCPQIVQFFSAFMHSCLEDKHITGWLRSFYDKTDFADILLMTGHPGCSDILSINRILKVYTKLISLADESQDTNHCSGLLKSLNKLLTLSESKLSEWLFKIIMASPGDLEPGDTESQVDNNALLLRTIASYMVKEGSSIDKAVPKSILSSLIVVGETVLHQTQNAQGFQELLLIMSTLAQSGESVSLFSSIIGWLESCIPYLTVKEAGEESGDAKRSKYVLYTELAASLLAYITDVLTIVKEIPMEGAASKVLWRDSAASDAVDDEMEATPSESVADTSDLDNLLCTFKETQRDFKQQHWYHCYTCSMTDGVGVCSVCVKVCHKNHDVSYAKHGSFFCDCGEKGSKFCSSLKKRSANDNNSALTVSRPPSGSGQKGVAGSPSNLPQSPRQQTNRQSKMAATLKEQRLNLKPQLLAKSEQILKVVEKTNLLSVVNKLLIALRADYMDRYTAAMPQEANSKAQTHVEQLETLTKTCDLSDSLMLAHMSSAENTFENVKPSYSGDQGTTIKQLISSHMIRRRIVCKVTVAGGKESMLAVACDKGKITMLQISSLFKSGMEKPTKLALTRCKASVVPFTILSMSVNPLDDSVVAVCGLKECHVLTLNETGTASKSTILHPSLDTGNFIVKAEWIPGKNSWLAVVTADFIKIYCLQLDAISPQYYYLLPSGKVRDVTFCVDPESGLAALLVMSSSGHVYTQYLDEDSKAVHGPFYITSSMDISHPLITKSGRVILGGGCSIYYSHSLKLLMVSFTQGHTYCCSLNFSSLAASNVTKVTFSGGKANSTQPMVQWSESYAHPGLVFCITQSTNTPLALYITSQKITVQEIKPSMLLKNSNNKATKVLDYVALKCHPSPSLLQTYMMLICEDGSLKILKANDDLVSLWIQPSLNPSSPFSFLKLNKSSRNKTSSGKVLTSTPQMCVDFFESCTHTNDVEYGGNDILQVYHRNLIKQRFAANNQYIACTKTDSFKMEIMNTSPSHVIAGIRIQVGGHLISRLPSYIEVFGERRAVNADRQRWLDFPFTREESILANTKIVITVGSSTHSDHVTFIDSIRVYSKSKDAFGWSEQEAAQLISQTNQLTASPKSVVSSSPPSADEQLDSEEGSDSETGAEVRSPLPTTSLDKLVADAFTVLTLYFLNSSTTTLPSQALVEKDTQAIEDLAGQLYVLLPPSCVEESLNMFLQALQVSKKSVHEQTDSLRVECIAKWMHLDSAQLNPCTYQLILDWIQQLGHYRQENFKLLSAAFTHDGNAEVQFLELLAEKFNHLYSQIPYHRMLAPICFSGLQNVKATVFALVDVLFLFVNENKDLLPNVVTLCLQLLFHKDMAVRFACKQAMIRILKPQSKAKKLIEKEIDEDSAASKKGTAKQPQTPQTPQTPRREVVAQAPPQAVPAVHHVPMDMAAEMLPPQHLGLHEWLGQDLEFAIALSLQDQNAEDDEDEEEGDDDDVEEQLHLMEAADNAGEFEVPPQADELPEEVSVAAEVNSDGGQISAHSSTEAMQSAGLSSIKTPQSDAIVPECDSLQRKTLRAAVRKEIMEQGLNRLTTCNGVTAVPFLQVLLLLLSDLDSPDDYVTLEVCLQELLGKTINFKQNWSDLTERSDKAEVELAVLRLFSVLMSRSHQSERPADSKVNVCAASVLIKTDCLDFFLPLLKQLLSFWKTYNPDGGTTDSHLLFTPQTVPKYDMSPFFLRQYVREHPTDVFEVFPQLQSEMVLRLINQMKKISDGSPELSSLKFTEEWTWVLSDYMGVCEAAFIKRQVRKLLSNICGSKENYRKVRDINTITTRMSLVKEAAVACGLTNNFDITARTTAIPYTTLTSMVENLKVVQDIASSRCLNWQKYCVKSGGNVELLLLLCVQLNQGLPDALLALLHSAVTKPAAEKSGSASSSLPVNDDDVVLHKQVIQEILTGVSPSLLSEFLRINLLQSNQTAVRDKTHAIVLSLFNEAESSKKIVLLNHVWSLWPQLPLYGKKAFMFVDILGYMIINADLPESAKTDFVRGITNLLIFCNKQLREHQNTNIYNMLQELVDLEGYYLEREPCMTCNDPEIPYNSYKLNNIKVDNKFTTTTHMIKLTSGHMISKIQVRLTDIKKSKMVKSMNINYSSRTVQSAVELKNRVGIWQLAKKVNLSANQSEVKIDFTVPITACNLMIEYTEFYENNQAVQESLPCPRCSASVPTNPGICVNCGENVFQCHKCRSINYDERDPFLCNSCGFCKYAKFDIVLVARPCSAVDPIETEEDRAKTLNSVNTMLEKADKTYSEMQSIRCTLERLIMQLSASKADSVTTSVTASAAGSVHINKFIQQVAQKYCDEAKKHFDELSKSMQKVIMCRRELLEFDSKQALETLEHRGLGDTPSSASVSGRPFFADQVKAEEEESKKTLEKLRLSQQSSSSCYGCLTVTVYHCISLIRALSTQSFAPDASPLIKELVLSNLNSGPMMLRHDAMQLLCSLTQDKYEANKLLYDMLYHRICEAMEFCTSAASLAMNIRSELAVVSLSVHADPNLWEERMRVVIKLYSQALLTGKSHVIEAVALSCLGIIKSQIVIDSKPLSSKHRDKTLQEIAGLEIADNHSLLNVGLWLSSNQWHSFSEWRNLTKSLSLKSKSKYDKNALQRKYFKIWKTNIRNRQAAMTELDEHSWLASVLFNPASQTSREMCADIVGRMSEVPHRKLLLVSFLSKLLAKVPSAGTHASNFITLYTKLVSEPEIKYYLIIKCNILMKIAEIISKEIADLCVLEETTLGSDLSQGWGLQALVSIVKSFLEDEKIRQRYKTKLVGTVLDGYLSLRKLVVQRTKMIESTQELLLGLLEQLTTGTEAETKEFMSVCIQTVGKYNPTDLRSPVFIFERLCSTIRPEENAVSDFLIILDKDPQQEEFLQGRMSGNPYLSKEPGLGPLMRDVKNKICTDCELVALLDDDSGMELLVNNKIISLDLPVVDVYLKVWQPARDNEPMRIVYRMRGLLGDATEDMINSLQSNDVEEEDAEKVYSMASVMPQCGGLQVMLTRLDYIHNYYRGKQLVQVLLKLFDYCLKLNVNRKEMIKPEIDTISVMLRALNRALRAEQQVGQTVTAPAGQSNTEKVVQLMEIVLSEASHLPPHDYTEFTKRCGDSNQLMLLLERIDSPFVRSNPAVLEALMRLIPFLACGEEDKMATLVNHFKPFLNFLEFDMNHTDNEMTYLECFCVIVSGIKENANGRRLKQLIIDKQILSDAIDYIAVRAPVVKTLLATDADDWKEFVSRPVLPYVLRLLNGMCSGHAVSQVKVGEAMIAILHKLEHMSSHGQIGSLAENLMETLCQNDSVKKQIQQIRAQTKAEKKRLAMAVREKHLSSIGMKTNKKGQVVVTSDLLKEADDLKEESGLICSICREGYHNQPSKVLALYTFTKRVNIEEHETRSRKLPGLFTVSHMNLVHADCHASAVRLASVRDEWESATLLNANSKCNGLLPLWGPQVPESNFASALAKHNTYLRDATDLRDDSYTLTVHDIKILLLKFANEQPFGADGGGGGRNSNMLLIPYELLLALYVIINKRTASVKEKNLRAFADTPKAKWVESSYEVDGPAYWLIISLALWSTEEWKKQKLVFLQRLLVMIQTRKLSSVGSKTLTDKTPQPYTLYKPMVVLFGLVDAIYNTMFKSVPCDGCWVESLMTYIRNNDMALSEASEKIVSFYECELLPCESLAEAFDVLGLLGEVSDPDEWLKALLQEIP